jgi:hypothetical protein
LTKYGSYRQYIQEVIILILHIKNQINGKPTVELCCGEKEYVLAPEEEVSVEVGEEDCIYLDVVR